MDDQRNRPGRRPPRWARPRQRSQAEAGNALLLSLGVTAIALSLGLTVVTSGVVTSQASGADRQRTSLAAAAESGIDAVHAQLGASTASWPCTSPQTLTIAGGSDPSTVTVTLQYLAANGSVTTCTGSPASLLVTSTAVASRSLNGGSAPSRTMTASFALASASSSSVTTVKEAIFGEGGVTVNNSFDLHESTTDAQDAAVYVNSGRYTCQSSETIQGTVTSQSDVVLGNTCSVNGSVWTAGSFSADPSTTVGGDVFAAASTSPGINLGNTARIVGNAFTNADVTLGNASVGGSVLSTQGKITFANGGHIDGSAYAELGLTYSNGSGGDVARDVVAAAGSIGSDATSVSGETFWSIGGNAAASPTGCITNTVVVSGTTSPAREPVGQSCSLPASPLTPTVAFPSAPNNPAGVSAPALPATVAPPAFRPFPTLYSRTVPSTGQDALDSWRNAGWDVHVFSGSDSQPCSQAYDYLKNAEAGAYHASWVAKPLAIVIQGCTDSFTWDTNNHYVFDGGSNTFTLYNNLAIISDRGINNSNNMSFVSDSDVSRNLLWIVPTDSPNAAASPSCPSWTADLTPNDVTTTNVNWFFFTPCAVNPTNGFGTVPQPIKGAVFGGSVTIGNGNLKFVPMEIPGLDDGSATGGSLSATLVYKREAGG